MNDKCKNYDPEFCPENCNEIPKKCGVCGKSILSLEGKINSYVIYSAETFCDDFERLDFEMIICKDCFNKIKKYEEVVPICHIEEHHSFDDNNICIWCKRRKSDLI